LKKSPEELQKHTLFLFEGDYEKIRATYPQLGAATVIRNIIRRFIQTKIDKGSIEMEIEIE